MKKTAHHNERIGQDWQRDTLCGDKRPDADDLGQTGEGVKSDIGARPASIGHRPLEMPAEDMAGHERIYGAQRVATAQCRDDLADCILEIGLERPDAQDPVRAHLDPR